MTSARDHETAWCADFERQLRQRRVRLRYRRSTTRGVVYACDRAGGRHATVCIPGSVVAAGVYGLRAALAESEDALSAAQATPYAQAPGSKSSGT